MSLQMAGSACLAYYVVGPATSDITEHHQMLGLHISAVLAVNGNNGIY